MVTCGWTCYIDGWRYYHYAIDIGGITGENIYPTANGTVVRVGYDDDGGNYAIIQHNVNGVAYASRYMHMARVFVTTNQKVSRDTVIGTVGNTGSFTTGPHLHFNISRGVYLQDFIWFQDTAVDPASLINFPPEDGWYSTRYGRY